MRRSDARHAAAALAVATALLAGCATPPPSPPAPPGGPGGRPTAPLPRPDRDGPEANPPPDLDKVPDATPRVEPQRAGGPNKPYEVLGQRYEPERGDPAIVERGLASWYGRKFHGRSTASGEVYNMYAMTAAHKTMPIPSYARVRNPANGREIIVRVNDRGPFHRDRIIDLSYTAALKLGVLNGVAPVEVERLTHEAIRTGSWQRGAPVVAEAPVALPAPAPAAVAAPASLPVATPAPVPEPVAAGVPDATPTATDPAPQRAFTPPQRGWWVQLGAFGQREGALAFHQKVEALATDFAPFLAVFNERQLHRLQAGPYASRAEAGQAADRLRELLQLVPVLVERR